MDAFDFDNNLMKVKKLFRIIEIFVALILLSWAATRLPFAVKISGEYFRLLVAVVVSHLFVFLLSNVIVLTLFFNFRNLFPQINSSEAHFDFCQEFIKNSDDGGGDAVTQFGGESSGKSEEIVYEDKKTILEVITRAKVPRRSLSENLRREKSLAEDYKQLRRSETELRRRMKVAAAENGEMVDELSNEEFQRTIDAFIAKQMKFHQEEKLAIVLHGCT